MRQRGRRWLATMIVGLLIGASLAACNDDNGDRASSPGSDETAPELATAWKLTDRLPVGGAALAERVGNVVLVGIEPDLVSYHTTNGIGWEPGRGLSEVEFYGQPVVVAGGPSGFVAGATKNGATPNEAVLAFSSDGLAWEPVDRGALPSPEISWLTAAAAGPNGFVVTGSGDERSGAFAWFSPDGRTWTPSNLPPLDGYYAVASSDSNWMAVGGEFLGDEPARVFASADGLEWVEIETGNSLRATIPAYAGVAPFIEFSGAWVLIPREGRGDPVIWLSRDDGQTWTTVAVASDSSSASNLILDVAVSDRGLVIVGTQDHGETSENFLLFSPDGSEWSRHGTVSDLAAIEAIGADLIALDTDGNVFVWSEE